MKTIVRLLMLIAITISACQKEGGKELVPEGKTTGNVPFSFVAEIPNGSAVWPIKWKQGDIVFAVTQDGTWGKPESADKNAATVAEFVYSNDEFSTKAPIPEKTYTFNLVFSGYDQKTLHRSDGSSNRLEAIQVQDCNNPTAHLKTHDALAGQIANLKTPSSDRISVKMYHLYSLIKVTLTNMTSSPFTPASLDIEATNTIAGVYSIRFQPTPSAEYVSDGSKTISLTFKNAPELKVKQSLDVYFVMAPWVNDPGNLILTVTDTGHNSYSKSFPVNKASIQAGSFDHIGYEIREDIEWDKPRRVCEGSYGRMHRLNDGRLMLVYSNGPADDKNACVRFSSDMGQTWTEETIAIRSFVATHNAESTPVRCVNTEFLQLSPTHPSHPNRIIYAVNLRATDNKSSIYPICVACSTSDDNGNSWSEPKVIYESQRWKTDVAKGAWEPFVFELPDGKIQVYFTDNTPYYKLYDAGEQSDNNRRGNNISVIESTDGGDSWKDYRIVCHSEGGWDGMASVINHMGNMYLAVEHKDKRVTESMSIQLIKNSVDSNWPSIEFSNSKNRFYPFSHSSGFDEGAPYLAQTDNFFIISCQCSEGGETADNLVAEVRAIAKSEIGADGAFPERMKSKSRPMTPVINEISTISKKTAKWNSLCPLPNDEVYLVSEHRTAIYIVKGRLSAQ